MCRKTLKTVIISGMVAGIVSTSALAGHYYDSVIARGYVKSTVPVTLQSVSPDCGIRTYVPKTALTGDLPETVFYRIVWKGGSGYQMTHSHTCNLKFSSGDGMCMATYNFIGPELQNVKFTHGNCSQFTDQLVLAKRVDILFK